jgi:hypothetical protein
MSNHLAIATVSAALREMVDKAVKLAVTGSTATHVRPGGTTVLTPEHGANVFLYGVTPNAALRGADLPTRDAAGRASQRPSAALDLHYLISFYGDDGKLETQRMMGSVVRALHAQPTLPRKLLRDVALGIGELAGSDLSEAPHAVRFTPVPLTLEELSKLWSVLFQTPYALSAAYHASVVTIEAEETARAALPVRSRGIHVIALHAPHIDAVEAADGPGEPVTDRTLLRIRGSGLKADDTRVRVGTSGAEGVPVGITPTEVIFPLAAIPAATLRAGIQGVQVVQVLPLGTPPLPHRAEESNVAAFVLRPRIRRKDDLPLSPDDALVHVPPPNPATPPRITAKLSPVVGKAQRVELLLNRVGEDGPAYRFAAPLPRTSDTDELTFDVPGVTPGTYLARVRVDGADSLLETEGGPAYVRPRVVVT